MSFAMVERLVGDLFPFAVGRVRSTTRRQVLRTATVLEADLGRFELGYHQTATLIDLGIDTTFVRSNAAESPRHHEVLIGVGTKDRGQAVKFGAVISALGLPNLWGVTSLSCAYTILILQM